MNSPAALCISVLRYWRHFLKRSTLLHVYDISIFGKITDSFHIITVIHLVSIYAGVVQYENECSTSLSWYYENTGTKDEIVFMIRLILSLIWCDAVIKYEYRGGARVQNTRKYLAVSNFDCESLGYWSFHLHRPLISMPDQFLVTSSENEKITRGIIKSGTLL